MTNDQNDILAICASVAPALRKILHLVDAEEAKHKMAYSEGHTPPANPQAGVLLTQAGCRNGVAVAGAIRVVEVYLRKTTNFNLTADEIIKWWRDNPSIEDSVSTVGKPRSRGVVGISFAGGMHFLFSLQNKTDADRFFYDFMSGYKRLGLSDPIVKLRNKLIDMVPPTGGARILTTRYCPTLIEMFIKCWNERRDSHGKNHGSTLPAGTTFDPPAIK